MAQLDSGPKGKGETFSDHGTPFYYMLSLHIRFPLKTIAA